MMALYRPDQRGRTPMPPFQAGIGTGLAQQPRLRLLVPGYRSGRPPRPARGERPHRRDRPQHRRQRRLRAAAAPVPERWPGRVSRCRRGSRRRVSPPPKSRAALAYGDFDRDGDLDLLITTNNGPAALYRNDISNGNRSLRLRLIGTKSNRDAIGATVRLTTPDGTQCRMVKTGSSYLSQSELALTFGLGTREEADNL